MATKKKSKRLTHLVDVEDWLTERIQEAYDEGYQAGYADAEDKYLATLYKIKDMI